MYGKLVRQAREARNMKSYELADAIGKQRSYVSRLEGGEIKETPPPEVMQAIWRVLGLSMRSQLIQLGYLEEEEAEPGIAYAVPEGSARAALLDALTLATDGDVQTITAIARVVPKSGLHNHGGMRQSDQDPPTSRSA